MKKGWQTVILIGGVVLLTACAKNKEQLVHSETMVIKTDSGEKKKEVRDPTDAGVEDDSPIIHYTPE